MVFGGGGAAAHALGGSAARMKLGRTSVVSRRDQQWYGALGQPNSSGLVRNPAKA